MIHPLVWRAAEVISQRERETDRERQRERERISLAFYLFIFLSFLFFSSASLLRYLAMYQKSRIAGLAFPGETQLRRSRAI